MDEPLIMAPGGVQYQIKQIDVWQSFIIISCIVLVILYISWVLSTQLSKEELEDMSEIMENFHSNPDYDDFMHIWNNKEKLMKKSGRPIKFWLYGVYLSQPQFYNDAKKECIAQWIREIERTVRRVVRNPSAESMDCIWSLYFATGSEEYSDVMRNIAADNANVTIRNAARWSYRNIMKRDWNEMPQVIVPGPAQTVEQLGRQVQQTEEQITAD